MDTSALERMLESRFSSFEEKMDKIIEERVEKRLNCFMEEFTDFKKLVTFLSNTVDEVSAVNKELKQEIKKVINENESLKRKLDATEITAKAAMTKSNEIDNHLRQNNIEIHGVPLYKQENVERLALSILKISDSNISKEDIDVVRRTGNPKNYDGTNKSS